MWLFWVIVPLVAALYALGLFGVWALLRWMASVEERFAHCLRTQSPDPDESGVDREEPDRH